MKGVVSGVSVVAVLWLALATVALADDPPTTVITSGPDGTSVLTNPRFDFISTKPATFECSLDGATFSPCASPVTVGPLALGPHNFAVRAIGPGGALELTPAVRQWTVEPALTPPTVSLREPARRKLHIDRLRAFSGTAVAPSGVMRVQVALASGSPNKDVFPPSCNFLDLRTGKPAPQACLLPHYFRAIGTDHWRFDVSSRLRKRLAPGRYTLTVRAFNMYQQATQQRFELTLR